MTNRLNLVPGTFAGVAFLSGPDLSSLARWFVKDLVGSRGDRRSHVHFLNAYSLSLCESDPLLRSVVLSSESVNFPDGKPISVLSRTRKPNAGLSQVRGPEMFEACLDIGREFGVRHFFLGSTESVLEDLCASVRSRYPRVEIVGVYSPPFRPLSRDELVDQDSRIERSGADIVWVGLGTPKQDFEVHRLSTAVSALPVAVGAAFSFSSGNLKVAPRWMVGLGLEWAFRLFCEPRRLWRRYLVGNFVFLRVAGRFRLGR